MCEPGVQKLDATFSWGEERRGLGGCSQIWVSGASTGISKKPVSLLGLRPGKALLLIPGGEIQGAPTQ